MGNTATVPERMPSLPPDDFLQSAREPLLDLLDRFEENEQQQKLMPLGEEVAKSIGLDRTRSSSSSWTGAGFLSRPAKPAWSSRRATFYKGNIPTSSLHRPASSSSALGTPSSENDNGDGTTTVVIKRLRLGQERGGRDYYWNEVRLFGEVSGSPHVVQLLGCCAERGEALLIYEYMPRGNLYDALFEVRRRAGSESIREKRPVLPFGTRLQIALDTALGLKALHDKFIIHLDVRPGNVLLDNEYRAKVAGLSASRMLAPKELGSNALEGNLHQHRIIGRIGYICPSYMETGQISAKTDIFAFGVVLLQLLCGRTFLPSDETGAVVSLTEMASRPEIGIVPEDVLRRKEKSAELSKQEFERTLVLRRQLDALREEMDRDRQKSGYIAPTPVELNQGTGRAASTVAFGRAQLDIDDTNNNSDVGQKVNRKGYARLEQPPSSEPSTPGGPPGGSFANGYARLAQPTSSETSTPSGPPRDSFASPAGGEEDRENLEQGGVELIRSFEAFMDPRLEGKYDEKAAREAAAVAIRCVQETPSARPKTEEVVQALEAIMGQMK